MKTVIRNGTEIKLTDTDYKTSGGEGDIYIKGGIVYKLYQKGVDPSFESKFRELSVLDDKHIIRPLDLLRDKSGNVVGYTMSYVDHSEAFPLLFTTSFRKRHGLDEASNKILIEEFVKTIQGIHDKKILIVDLNEYNFMIDQNGFKVPYFIDVDSYQTKSFPAKVIMASVSDYSVSPDKFSELSDWFSFGVLAFQLYTGIHPYKGTHAAYGKSDLEKRMRDKVSVFNKSVSMPPSVRPIDSIPDSLKSWFEDIFEKGKRLPPPIISTGITKKVKYDSIISDAIVSSLVYTTIEPIEAHVFIEGNRVLYTKNWIYINTKAFARNNNSRVIFKDGQFYEIWISSNVLQVSHIGTSHNLLSNDMAGKFFVMYNRLYRFGEDNLYQLQLTKLANNTFNVAIKNSWAVKENSTKVYYNILVSELLGTYYFNIPNEDNKCSIIRAPDELKGYKIIDVYFNKGFLLIVGFRNGVYDRLLIRIDSDYSYTSVTVESDISLQEINATVNNKGIMALCEGDRFIITNGASSKVLQGVVDIGTLVSEYENIYAIKDDHISLIKTNPGA